VYIRGSTAGVEYKRNDQSFYKGTIVQNNDPEALMRVKVYIPEISNEPLDNWLNKNEAIRTKMPGVNNKTDSWEDTDIFHEIKDLLPWAEPCLPLMGESGPGRFWSNIDDGISSISDSNYVMDYKKNDTKPVDIQNGLSGPAFFYEASGLKQGDAFNDPTKNSTAINNPNSYDFQPIKHVNGSKGVYGVPNVGAQVWVFHYNGDLNFPVYFGGRAGYGDIATIMATEQGEFGQPAISQDLPSGSENDRPGIEEFPPLPPGERGDGTVIEDTKGKIRNKPIASSLKSFLSEAGSESNVTVVVTSGGQPRVGRRTGSHRHDNGYAADFLIKDNVSGKAIPIRNTARWAAFTKAFRRAANSAGYTTSGGAGSSYMGDYTAHFDIAAGVNPGVRQATWGGSGRPGWVSLLVN
jgi:hypothetical protein